MLKPAIEAEEQALFSGGNTRDMDVESPEQLIARFADGITPEPVWTTKIPV